MNNAPRLRLNSLHIGREQPWATTDKGLLKGTVDLESVDGSITIKIDNETAEKIIVLCAEGLKNEAKRFANLMTSQILEAVNPASGNLLEHQK